MTRQFASIELARLYEAQGYFQDALSMYKALDDDVLMGGAEIRASVKRLELALLKEGSEPDADLSDAMDTEFEMSADPGAFIVSTLADLNGDPVLEPDLPKQPKTAEEKKIARLMEKWLAFMVVRKRLQSFKRIRARV